MKLTKLFSYPVDQGGVVTRNYIKLFSKCTEDQLKSYYRYLYQNKMYSELGNFTDALRLFTARYNGWNPFKLIIDRIQRARAASQIRQARRDRDVINKARELKGIDSGLISKDTGKEAIINPDVDYTDKVNYGDNPAEKAAWDILNGFQSTRGEYNSHGEMKKLDLGAARKSLNNSSWNDDKFYKTIENDAAKKGQYQDQIIKNALGDNYQKVDDLVTDYLNKTGGTVAPKPVINPNKPRKAHRYVRNTAKG